MTAEAPENSVPAITTAVPGVPEPGEKPVIVGGASTVKGEGDAAVPTTVVTVTGPEVAAGGTVAWIELAEFTVNAAARPLNWTAVVPRKLLPETVTLAPTIPLVGERLEMTGGNGPVTV